MNKVYQMQFDTEYYDELCDLLTIYETGYDLEIDWEKRFYMVLVGVQNKLAKAIN